MKLDTESKAGPAPGTAAERGPGAALGMGSGVEGAVAAVMGDRAAPTFIPVGSPDEILSAFRKRLPDPMTPSDQLTDDERMALVIVAGEEVDVLPGDNENLCFLTTRYPVGFFNGKDGRVRVMRLSADLKRKIDEDRKNAPRIAL